MLALTLVLSATEPAYVFRPEIDLPIAGVAGAVAVGWVFRHQLSPAWCAPRCDPSALNSVDRLAAGRFSAAFGLASHVSVGLVLASSVLVPIVDEGSAGLGDALIVAQTIVVANAVGVVSQMSVRRPRPLLYGESAPVSERTDGNGSLSFFSGHASSTFAGALAAFGVIARRHPGSAAKWVTFAVGMLGASTVATLRVLAGQHFPTDVLAGALVGTSIGVLIPALHDRPLAIASVPTAGGVTLVVQGQI